MARAIDADELEMFPYSEGAGTEEQISEWIEQVGLFEDDTASRAKDLCWKVIDGFINVVKTQPTLTPPNEWVSVEDALPPNMDDVLVVVQNNGECWTVTGYYSNTSNVWYAMLNGQDTQMDVLWWMPLPAPFDRRPPEGDR